jgi:hypothetical protein
MPNGSQNTKTCYSISSDRRTELNQSHSYRGCFPVDAVASAPNQSSVRAARARLTHRKHQHRFHPAAKSLGVRAGSGCCSAVSFPSLRSLVRRWHGYASTVQRILRSSERSRPQRSYRGSSGRVQEADTRWSACVRGADLGASNSATHSSAMAARVGKLPRPARRPGQGSGGFTHASPIRLGSGLVCCVTRRPTLGS